MRLKDLLEAAACRLQRRPRPLAEVGWLLSGVVRRGRGGQQEKEEHDTPLPPWRRPRHATKLKKSSFRELIENDMSYIVQL